MKIPEIFQKGKATLSFEFFPPKNPEASQRLFYTIHNLIPLKPAYVSVTYGAGGSSRLLTHDLVVRIQREVGLEVVAHLTCIGSRKDEIFEILHRYQTNGIHNILALRGDFSGGESGMENGVNDFSHAADLVRFIKNSFPDMSIGVAGFVDGHPQSQNTLMEMDYFKEKVDAGADYICTQLFFNNPDFYDFRERCHLAGIHIPIIAGIMPVTSKKNLYRMAELAPRSRFPAALLRAIQNANSDEEVEGIGIDWTARQVDELLDREVSGVHFYTLNKSKQIHHICASLDMKRFYTHPGAD